MDKINADIKRNIDGNQLVIKCGNLDYRLKMLEANKIPGLLPLTIKECDGEKMLYYDITSKECFAGLVASRTMKVNDIRSFIYCLSRIIISIEAYLLDPEDLILDKEYIYVSGEDMEPSLCYLPGYGGDFTSKLSSLLQDMLGMVDHNDHDAVVLAYSLYQESLRQGYVMKDLLRILHEDLKVAASAASTDGMSNAGKGNKNQAGVTNGGQHSNDYDGAVKGENLVEQPIMNENGINYVMVSQDEKPVLTEKEYESLYDALDMTPKEMREAAKEAKSHRRKRGVMFNLW